VAHFAWPAKHAFAVVGLGFAYKVLFRVATSVSTFAPVAAASSAVRHGFVAVAFASIFGMQPLGDRAGRGRDENGYRHGHDGLQRVGTDLLCLDDFVDEDAVGVLGGVEIGGHSGVPFGFLMATQDKLNNFLDPWVSAIYATPRVALAPIIIVWFGLGIFPSSLVVFLGAVFPILLNTYTGIRSVKPNLIEVVRAFGGSPAQIFFKVMIPDATPAIIAGMRLAVGRAVIGVVVAELFGAEAGIGFMVYLYSQRFMPGPVFVGIVILVVFGIATFVALEKLQRWLSPWYDYQLQQRMQGLEME